MLGQFGLASLGRPDTHERGLKQPGQQHGNLQSRHLRLEVRSLTSLRGRRGTQCELAPLASSKVVEVEKETTGTISDEKFYDLQM